MEEIVEKTSQQSQNGPELKIWKSTHERVVFVFVESGSSHNACWEECRFAFEIPPDEVPTGPTLESYFSVIERETKNKFTSVVVLNETCNMKFPKFIVRNPHPHFTSQPLCDSQGRDSRSCRLEMLFYAQFLCENRQSMDLLSAATSTRWYFGRMFDRAFSSYSDFIHTLLTTHHRQTVLGFPRLRSKMQTTLSQIGSTLIEANTRAIDATIRFAVVNTRSATVREKSLVSEGNEGAADAADEMFEMGIKFTKEHRDLLIVAVFPFDICSIFLFRRGGMLRLDVGVEFECTIKSMCEMGVGFIFNEVEIVSVRRYLDGRCDYGVCAERTYGIDGVDVENELEVVHIDDLLENC